MGGASAPTFFAQVAAKRNNSVGAEAPSIRAPGKSARLRWRRAAFAHGDGRRPVPPRGLASRSSARS
ncbi:DUF6053 domain-containing protein [Lysobacter enzymogenes]|uniref:DUF6053 domain-containing protein n=1 Tax=Lysobacter enzymogenes TaxID=69 RepID=UPI003D18800D